MASRTSCRHCRRQGRSGRPRGRPASEQCRANRLGAAEQAGGALGQAKPERRERHNPGARLTFWRLGACIKPTHSHRQSELRPAAQGHVSSVRRIVDIHRTIGRQHFGDHASILRSWSNAASLPVTRIPRCTRCGLNCQRANFLAPAASVCSWIFRHRGLLQNVRFDFRKMRRRWF
jgi:hypothetical protein